MCYNHAADPCAYSAFQPHVFFSCPDPTWAWDWRWLGLLWAASQFWITSHIWQPKNEKLEKTDHIFGADLYNGLVGELSVDNGLAHHTVIFPLVGDRPIVDAEQAERQVRGCGARAGRGETMDQRVTS